MGQRRAEVVGFSTSEVFSRTAGCVSKSYSVPELSVSDVSDSSKGKPTFSSEVFRDSSMGNPSFVGVYPFPSKEGPACRDFFHVEGSQFPSADDQVV